MIGLYHFVLSYQGETHDQTISLLKEHINFRMSSNQITIIKQKNYLLLFDNECHLACASIYWSKLKIWI